MSLHCSLGPVWVRSSNRVAYGAMLGSGTFPSAVVLETGRKPLKVWIDALVEQLANKALQHGIAKHRGNGCVKLAVNSDHGVAVFWEILHALQHLIQSLDVGSRRFQRRFRCDSTFDELPGPQKFEWPLNAVDVADLRWRDSGVGDVDSRTYPDIYQPLNLKRDERLA